MGKAAAAVLKDCGSAELTLATAESCSSALLGSLLTDVEGASHAFERGFVVYSEDAKCELLGIRSERIEACGAVSREVAVAMAEGAIERRSEEHTSELQSLMRISYAVFCLKKKKKTKKVIH